jgi:hypothetical protein
MGVVYRARARRGLYMGKRGAGHRIVGFAALHPATVIGAHSGHNTAAGTRLGHIWAQIFSGRSFVFVETARK